MKKRAVTVVVFGGTGDLAKRKLFPALSLIAKRGALDKKSPIIGVGRRDLDNESYRKFVGVSNLNVEYFKADFAKNGLSGLKEFLKKVEGKANNRIFYLATSFRFFPTIVKELKKYGLDKKRGKFVRVIFEKPFGHDLKSSNALDKGVHSVFSEKDVYRIDHYLGKETVRNIEIMKSSNPVFEGMLNNKYVESVELIVDEKLGVGNRIEYYNESGSIKDMMQNHLLQTISLFLMDVPKKRTAENVHEAKASVLKRLGVLGAKNHLLGQYKSYLNEAKKYGIKKSDTETFSKIVLECNNKRWRGVPIVLRTGKKLKRKYGLLRIKFRRDECRMFEDDKIEISIFPKQRALFRVRSGPECTSPMIRPTSFIFCKDCSFIPNSVEEYENLLGDVIAGDKALFSTSDEIRESWKIIDKIKKMKSRIKFVRYNDYSDPEA